MQSVALTQRPRTQRFKNTRVLFDTHRKNVYGFDKHKSPVFNCRRALEKLTPPQQAALAKLLGFISASEKRSIGKPLETIEFKRAHRLIRKMPVALLQPLFEPLGYRAATEQNSAVPEVAAGSVISASNFGTAARTTVEQRPTQITKQQRIKPPPTAMSEGATVREEAHTSRSFTTSAMQHMGKCSSYIPTYVPERFPYTSCDQTCKLAACNWVSNNLAKQPHRPAPTPRSYNPSDAEYHQTPRPAPIEPVFKNIEGWAPNRQPLASSRPCTGYVTIARRGKARTNCGSFYNPHVMLEPNVRHQLVLQPNARRPQTR